MSGESRARDERVVERERGNSGGETRARDERVVERERGNSGGETRARDERVVEREPAAMSAAGWSERAWRSVSGWYAAIVQHPFVGSLGDGTLAEDVFVRYLVDDSHYLVGYARALSALSARTGEPGPAALLAASAAQGVQAERDLHAAYLLPRGIDPSAAHAPEPSPTCVGYVGMVQTLAAFAPVEVGLAGVLPCFRVYAEVGRELLATAPAAGHPYRDWIDAYADPAFEDAVRDVERHVDAVADATTSARRDEMLAAYVRATRYEWMFWDAAWRGETWP